MHGFAGAYAFRDKCNCRGRARSTHLLMCRTYRRLREGSSMLDPYNEHHPENVSKYPGSPLLLKIIQCSRVVCTREHSHRRADAKEKAMVCQLSRCRFFWL